MIKQLLKPRPDVISGKLQGVIDIERVTDRKGHALEARVKDFLASTYVSGEIRSLITKLNKRLNSSDAETGLFLAEGHKGEGKSHVLLVALHLIQHAGELAAWLAANKLEFSLPQGTRVIWRKFTDFPLESLWGVIAQELKAEFPKDRPPNIHEFRAAVGNQKLVLIFDELESGVRAISNPALQQQNLNFLQMISEEANRADSNIAVIASIYDGRVEPGLTLKRVARVEMRFQDASDRRKILFHRLFERSPLDSSPEIDAIIQSHLNSWKRFGIPVPPDYADHFRLSYPFVPEVLEVVLERIRALRGGFQGTRGALGFLAALVRLRFESAHVITLSDASLLDAEMKSWLSDLDPAQNLLGCAEANLRELKRHPFADQIASAVLLASLAPTAKDQGLTEDELARQIIRPDSDYNAMGLSLTQFKKFGSYFHDRSGELFFDTKENANSKVNLRSLTVSDEDAWDRVVSWWANDIFRDPDLVVFSDPDQTQRQLESKANADIQLVAAPRHLTNEEVRRLYFGLKNRNMVLLLEPRDEKVDLRVNDSLLAYAKRWVAAEHLSRSAGDATKNAEFQKIGAEDKRFALDYLKKTNFCYIQILRYGPSEKDCEFQRESVPSTATREQMIEHIGRNFYPPAFVQEHLLDNLAVFIGRKVGQVEADYRNTPGYPVLTKRTVFLDAVATLVEQGTHLGLEHPSRNFCGELPSYTNDQLLDAVMSQPFQSITGGPAAQRMQSSPNQPNLFPDRGAPSPNLPGNYQPLPAPGAMPATLETDSTGFLKSRQEVRQEVARRLDAHENKKIVHVRIGLTYDLRHLDLGSLPSFLRGTLSGEGSFSGEFVLDLPGSYTKAQVEQLMERLPDFTPGACRVTIQLQLREEAAHV
ncbi:MAG: hypothetical protein LV481_11190 [Methylacidiphilales bacterium]|nr:hypothetical protein [Candidatus Methylacidiphilales bacterium]